MRNFTEFLLMGFSGAWVPQKVCAMPLSLIYLAALTGNLLLIIIVLTNPDWHLQSPLYFFLRNLSFIEVCYISVTVPNSMVNSLTSVYSISFLSSALQAFFLPVFGGIEFALLLMMSYHHYTAICNLLHYEAATHKSSCVWMVPASWLGGGLYGALQVAGTFSVHFYEASRVPQFFCEAPSLVNLACPGESALEYGLIIASCGLFSCVLL
nr:putative olfactory receptor 14L1 [Cavia porcellus]